VISGVLAKLVKALFRVVGSGWPRRVFHTDSQKFSHGLFVGLVAPSGSFDLVHDVVKDGLVDVEDAGAESL